MTNKLFELSGKRIWVAGDRGMVGSAISRALTAQSVDLVVSEHERLDLRRQNDVEAFLRLQRPDAIFLAAGKVGGIYANDTRPAEFIYDNLMIESNIVAGAHAIGVKKLLFLGSSCIYPRDAAQPLREEALLSGPLEPTNEWYAVAKIAGIKLCQAFRRQYGADFISVMPTNLYGPNDNFDLNSSHVLPALMRKIHSAKVAGEHVVTLWGSGKSLREFMHVDDLADALIFLMENYSEEQHINVGTGTDCSIAEAAQTIARVVGYEGRFVYDASKPDGSPRKCTDVARLRALGFHRARPLEEGLRDTYKWFLSNFASARGMR